MKGVAWLSKNMNNKLVSWEKASQMLKKGRIGIFPTDTAFGIGCVIDDQKAIRRLFEIKKRPENKPTPVLVDSREMASRILCAKIHPEAEQLIGKYWPGGLTVVLVSKNSALSPLVTGGTNTLGIRIPDSKPVIKMIQNVGVPILAPSANFSTSPTPYNISDVDPELLKLVDFMVEGKCKTKIASTVIDCTHKPFRILRTGVVKVDSEFL